MGWRELLAAADAQVPGFRKTLLRAAEEAGAAVNWAVVEDRLKKTQYAEAAQAVAQGYQAVAQDFEAVFAGHYQGAFDAGAAIAAGDLSLTGDALLGGTFRLTNPSAVLYASTKSSALIVQITDQQRQAVRQIVTAATAGGLTAEGVARQVRQVVGLDPRRAGALARFAQERFAQATTPKAQAAAQKAVYRYRGRLLRARAEVIARTEVLTSAHQGQLEVWIEAKNRGEVGAGMVKRWIVTPDDRLCPYCAPLHGQQVLVTEPFKTPYGPKQMPPAHPQCRCVSGLVKGKPTEGKGAPKPFTSPPSVAAPRVPLDEPPRSMPLAVPPTPANVLKVRSLGIDDAGRLKTLPAPMVDAPWDPSVLSALESDLGAGVPFRTVQLADLQGVVTTKGPMAADVEHWALHGTLKTGSAPSPSVVRFGGKQYVHRGYIQTTGDWANGVAERTVKYYDLDDYVSSGKHAVHGLKTELGVTDGIFHKHPTLMSPYNSLQDAMGATGADIADAFAAMQKAKPPAIPFFPKQLTSTLDSALPNVDDTVAALGATPKPITVWKYTPPGATQPQYLTMNVDEGANAIAAAYAKNQPIPARVVDFDKFLASKPTNSIAALGLDELGNVANLPFGAMPAHGGLSQTTWSTAIKKTSGVLSDVPVAKIKVQSGTVVKPPLSLEAGYTPTVMKLGDDYWVQGAQSADEFLKAWAKGIDSVQAHLVDLTPEVQAFKASKKAAAVKHAAKKKAAKTGTQPPAPIPTPGPQYQVTPSGLKPVAPAPPPLAPSGPPPQVDLDALVKKQVGPQGGSNPGGLYQAPDGSKWYVKFYQDKRQAQGEVLANRIYNDLGLGAPQSVSGPLADGRYAFASKYLDDVRGTVGQLGMTEVQANQILDGFVADVLTANWDAVGTGLDNVVVLANGSIRRIDQGGSFLFRAKAGTKPDAVLNSITEWEAFLNKNPYYSQVFQKAGLGDADELGQRAISQIDHVLTLQKRYGNWRGYLDAAVPDLDAASRTRIAQMLDARTKHLEAKRTALLSHLNQPKAPNPSGWLYTDDQIRKAYEFAGVDAGRHRALTAEQKAALSRYTNGGYGPLNKAVTKWSKAGQKGAPPAEYKDWMRELDAALDKARLSKRHVVWRGVHISDPDARRAIDQAVSSNGELTFHGYSSTSTSPTFASSWGSNDYVFEIETDHGMWVKPISYHSSEAEFLLPRGTVFQVVGKKAVKMTGGHTVTVIQLRYLRLYRP